MSRNLISQFASSNGDGTGTTNLIGDYSDGGDGLSVFAVEPVSKAIVIRRMIATIEDSGAPDSGKYGNNITLTNGITITVNEANNDVRSTLTPDPVMTNAEWATYCHDLTAHTWGSGNDTLTVRWTFTKGIGDDGVVLDPGESIRVILNDDFSDLVAHKFLFQGSG